LYLASLTHVPQMSLQLRQAPPWNLQQARPSSAQQWHVQQALP
jgi:hypothetical protein